MNLAPAEKILVFEVTYDRPDLFVGMMVYDTTPSTPVLVQGPTLMAHIHSNTYAGKFGGEDQRSYVICKAVYTSSALTTLNTDYSEASESIFAQVIGGGSGGGGSAGNLTVLGFIEPNETLVGFIEDNNSLLGLIEC